tara:strand:+ start:1599 stop:1730 length:132 start_codon:yes stop_codon:yes gene_type:complete
MTFAANMGPGGAKKPQKGLKKHPSYRKEAAEIFKFFKVMKSHE